MTPTSAPNSTHLHDFEYWINVNTNKPETYTYALCLAYRYLCERFPQRPASEIPDAAEALADLYADHHDL